MAVSMSFAPGGCPNSSTNSITSPRSTSGRRCLLSKELPSIEARPPPLPAARDEASPVHVQRTHCAKNGCGKAKQGELPRTNGSCLKQPAGRRMWKGNHGRRNTRMSNETSNDNKKASKDSPHMAGPVTFEICLTCLLENERTSQTRCHCAEVTMVSNAPKYDSAYLRGMIAKRSFTPPYAPNEGASKGKSSVSSAIKLLWMAAIDGIGKNQ
mmetsp:Transcript_80490/g.260673  ORF Transcript_80490/g.260673 Transcript_80490/m.260673 type:complete len:212 (+) Transcript_80490:680-1315(+)